MWHSEDFPFPFISCGWLISKIHNHLIFSAKCFIINLFLIIYLAMLIWFACSRQCLLWVETAQPPDQSTVVCISSSVRYVVSVISHVKTAESFYIPCFRIRSHQEFATVRYTFRLTFTARIVGHFSLIIRWNFLMWSHLLIELSILAFFLFDNNLRRFCLLVKRAHYEVIFAKI